MSSPIFYCYECKSILTKNKLKINNLCFCNDSCLEDFYYPLKRHWYNYVSELFNIYGDISDIDPLIPLEVKSLLKNSDEIYEFRNDMNECFHVFISEKKYVYDVAVLLINEGKIAFEFISFRTPNESVVDCFKTDKKININDLNISTESMIDDEEVQKIGEFIEDLENKKSTLLVDVLSNLSPDDIQIEDFSFYDSYFNQTLNQPDETFESKDEYGDLIQYNLSQFSEGDRKFYYVVCSLKIKDINDFKIYPILGYPTINKNLISLIKTYKKTNSLISN